jgi:hypothetical protein
VSELETHAAGLFELAQSNAFADRYEPSDVHVLIGSQGDLRIIMESDENWSLDALRAYHGSECSYRITRLGGCVTVEGRSLQQSCRFETASGHAIWGQMMAGTSCYEIVNGPDAI